MPTYEYECQSCHQRIEAVQHFSDPPLTTCPHCGGALRKVFSAVGIVFKGSGFYKTDSRSTSVSATPPGPTPSANSPSTNAGPSAPAPSPSPAPAASTSD